LTDPSHEIAFNLTMIVLCLVAMGFGSFLRIRLYLAMGFAGLMVDLVSILYKVLVHMERNARMTVMEAWCWASAPPSFFPPSITKRTKHYWTAGWINGGGNWLNGSKVLTAPKFVSHAPFHSSPLRR